MLIYCAVVLVFATLEWLLQLLLVVSFNSSLHHFLPSSHNTTTQQHIDTSTHQHNDTTTQRHNDTTTQRHNDTTTQQKERKGEFG
jgi:hypothetical protein